MTDQQIMIAFDNSSGALDALAFGSWLARHTGDELLVVATYPKDAMPVLPGIGIDYQNELKQSAQEALSSARDILDGQAARFRCVGATSTARGLDGVADREDVSMIVIGSGRRAPHRRVANTRTANHLLHGASVPVVLAPRGIRERALAPASRIGCAFTPSKDGRAALRHAANLAQQAKAGLEVFTVAAPPVTPHGVDRKTERAYLRNARTAFTEELEKAAKSLPSDLSVSTHLLEGDPVDALSALDERDCQLLVCGSRGYGPVRRVLLGSVSEQLVRHAACPVMVTPRGHRP